MDILILEVDGSLRNPLAAAAVAIWALVLSCIALVAALPRAQPVVRFGALIVAMVISTATRSAQHWIGGAMYSLADWRIVDVGFWYGPPTWIAPLVAAVVGTAAWIGRRKWPSSPAPANRPLQPTSGAGGTG